MTNWISIFALHALIKSGLYAFTLISLGVLLRNIVVLFRDERIAKISQRVGAVTGLNMATSEELQVSNYGIGGHYEPHYDFARREETNAFASLGTGNRIATWLFYVRIHTVTNFWLFLFFAMKTHVSIWLLFSVANFFNQGFLRLLNHAQSASS